MVVGGGGLEGGATVVLDGGSVVVVVVVVVVAPAVGLPLQSMPSRWYSAENVSTLGTRPSA